MSEAVQAAKDCEVAIVGGGPAGLSAALVLGRCRRRVVLFDSGQYRNAVSRAAHGFLSRDGIDPAELRRISYEQLARYDSLRVVRAEVTRAACVDGGFELTTADGENLRCRKLLLATGLVDRLPDIAGARELYGKSVHHCPYCDAWEVRDQPLAVFGRGDDDGGGLALALTRWSSDVVLFTDGPGGLTDDGKGRLDRQRVAVREERITRLTGDETQVVFELATGERVTRRALFFNTSCDQRSDLAAQLGCRFDKKGGVVCEGGCAEGVAGLYIAGDASRDVLQSIVAAGEGSEAAVRINGALLKEDLY